MSKNSSITMEKRDFSENPRKLRASGKVPATIYGHGFSPVSIQLDSKKFANLYKDDKTALIELKDKNDSFSVLVKNVQFHPTSSQILNIEFQAIKTDEKIKVSVPVEIVGVSPAVKAGAALRVSIDEIEVECLPKDIPAKISVDISALENVEDTITVGEIKYPAGVVPITASDNVVARASTPKAAAAEGPVTDAQAAAETVEA